MENAPKPEQPKKKRRKWPWITLGIVIVVIGVPLMLLGSLGTSKPKDLGVHPTAADLASVQAKTPLKIQGDAATFSVFGEKTYSGTVPVDNQLTSAELTAWVQHYTKTDGDISDVQVKFHEGGMEISAFAKRYISSPIYVDVDVVRTGPNSAALNVKKGKVGMLSVPEKYLKMFNDYAQDVLNEHLADIPGFSMADLQYHDGYRVFKGTYPQTVTASTGTWW